MPSAERYRSGGRPLVVAAVAAGSLTAVVLCLLVGRYPQAGLMDPALLVSDPTARAIVLGSRLPRLVAALLLGASMAAAGNAFQMVFGNPLVEPGFLGVTQGAALGAAVALTLGLPGDGWLVGLAFSGALAGLAASAGLARLFNFGGWVLRLVLSGLAVSAFLAALLAIVKFAADPLRQLPDIAYWTMGSLAGVSFARLGLALPVCLLSVGFLLLWRWRITALSLDEGVAVSLGARPSRERWLVLAVASAGVAAIVSVAGVVGWIGLVIPHAARLIGGADGRRSMPLAVALGSAFAVFCDTLARAALPGELPLGAITAVLGAALFVALLAGRRSGVWR